MIGRLWEHTCLGSLARILYKFSWRKIEHIPESQKLWRVVSKPQQIKKDGKPKPSFFRDSTGLSCDLAIFTSIRKCKAGRLPEAGIVEFEVSTVRSPAVGADVGHKPVMVPRWNYAHCELTKVLTNDGISVLIQKHRYVVPQGFWPANTPR